MQYSQEHLKTMVYAEFGGQTECIMGNWKIVNGTVRVLFKTRLIFPRINGPIEVKKTWLYYFGECMATNHADSQRHKDTHRTPKHRVSKHMTHTEYSRQ